MLPSDSAYILTGILDPDVSGILNTLLHRERLKISLAFEDVDTVRNMMNLSSAALKFVESLMPGGLTFVARPKDIMLQLFSEKMLYADGTIGIRVTESLTERQIAGCLKGVLPSTPIHDQSGKAVSSCEEAVKIVSQEMKTAKLSKKFAAVDGTVPYPGRWSTVVKENDLNHLHKLTILRENAIPASEIERIARACGYSEVCLI